MFRPLTLSESVTRIRLLFETNPERAVTLDELRRWFGHSSSCADAVAILVTAGLIRWNDHEKLVRSDKPDSM
jgi:hypothetical protein